MCAGTSRPSAFISSTPCAIVSTTVEWRLRIVCNVSLNLHIIHHRCQLNDTRRTTTCKTWIACNGSGSGPGHISRGFGGSGPDLDPAKSKINGSGWDPDPRWDVAGSVLYLSLQFINCSSDRCNYTQITICTQMSNSKITNQFSPTVSNQWRSSRDSSLGLKKSRDSVLMSWSWSLDKSLGPCLALDPSSLGFLVSEVRYHVQNYSTIFLERVILSEKPIFQGFRVHLQRYNIFSIFL